MYALLFEDVPRGGKPVHLRRSGAASSLPHSQLAHHSVCHAGVRHGEQEQTGHREAFPNLTWHMRPHALWACKACTTFFLTWTFWWVLCRPSHT